MVVAVTQPDRRRGRGRRASPCPVAACAREADLPVLQPERAGDAAFAEALQGFEPDLGVVVAFGQFLPKRIRHLPTLGYLLNGHASLLPKLRGAAPIVRAVLQGEQKTGVSVMRVEREMDAGPVALTREIAIGPEENAGELAHRLAHLTADAIEEALRQAAAGEIHWLAQDDSRASLAPKLERDEAQIDWNRPVRDIALQVRAMAPKPGAFTHLEGEALRILAACALPGAVDCPVGSVRCDASTPLRVAARDGWLAPTVLQRPGKRPLDVHEFLRGRAIPDGIRFGDDSLTARLSR